MADLGEAIGLQGKPNVPSTRQTFTDLINLELRKGNAEAQKQKALRDELAKRQGERDKIIESSVDVDYNKIHPLLKDKALSSAKNFLGYATQVNESQEPNAGFKIKSKGLDFKNEISKYADASKNLFAFEQYASKGYLNEEDKKVFDYIKTANPMYLKDFDLAKSAAVKAFDPETNTLVFNEFQYMDLPAHISKNLYKNTQDRVVGSSGRFDVVEEAYDREGIKQLAMNELMGSPVDSPLYKNVEQKFRADVLNQLKTEIDPVTGKARYPEITQYTLQDPTFISDYNELLAEKYGDYAANLGVPQTQRLMARPQPSVTNNYINTGEGGSATGQGTEGEYSVGFQSPDQFQGIDEGKPVGKQFSETVARYYSPMQGQKVQIVKGSDWKNIYGGSSFTQRGAQEGVLSGIYTVPVFNKRLKEYEGQLVKKDEIDKYDKDGFVEWKPMVFATIGDDTFYAPYDKATGISRILSVSKEEKPLVDQEVRKAYIVAERENKKGIEKRKAIKSTTPASKTTTQPTKQKKTIQGF